MRKEITRYDLERSELQRNKKLCSGHHFKLVRWPIKTVLSEQSEFCVDISKMSLFWLECKCLFVGLSVELTT